MQSPKTHHYRIALYGAKGHGKTCLLAALGSARSPNPREHVCTRLPRTQDDASGEKDKAKASPERKALIRGYDWVEKAERALLEGNVPQPNENEEPLALRYRFNLADKRNCIVELIDYSGELLDPNTQTDDLAEKLRAHMENLDALLVLAPFPSPSADAGIPQQLHGLEGALSLLHKDKNRPPPIPIAFIVNKWDYRGPINHDDYEAEQQALLDFLDSEGKTTGHTNLRNHLSSLADDDDNFHAFAVSAFGEHESKATKVGSGKDKQAVPKLTKGDAADARILSSFAIEDPFAWVIDRRDEIDRNALKEDALDALRRSIWKFPPAWGRTGEITERHEGLVKRYPPKDSRLRPTKKLLGKLNALKWAAVLCSVLYAYGIWTLSNGVYGFVKHASSKSTLEDVQADSVAVDEATQWLSGYANGSIPLFWHGYLYFVHSPEETRKFVREVFEKGDHEAWAKFKPTDDATKRKTVCEDYIRDWPNGLHLVEAKNERDNALRDIARGKHDNRLNELEAQKDAVFGRGNLATRIDGLRNLKDEIDATFPDEELMSDKARKERNELAQQVRTKLVQATADLQRTDLIEEYYDSMKDGKLWQAVEALKALGLTQGQSKEILHFKKLFFETLGKEVDKHVVYKNWDQASAIISDMRRLPPILRPELSSYKTQLNDVKRELDETQDKYFYRRLQEKVKHGSSSNTAILAAKNYLENGPIQKRNKEVTVYKNYLTTKDKRHNRALIFTSISWDAQAEDEDDFKLRVLGKVPGTLDWSFPYFKSKPGSFSNVPRKRLGISPSLTDVMTFSITLHEIDDVSSNDYHGGFNGSRTIRDLMNKGHFELKGGDYGIQYLNYKIEGGPKEPKLPGW